MQHCSYRCKWLSSPWRTMHLNLAKKTREGSSLVFKMTGTVQRTVCYFHLCQFPLKCAQLPQPATMGAAGRPFAEQWIISPFWFGAVPTPAVIDLLPHSKDSSDCCVLPRNWEGKRNERPSSPSPGEKKKINCAFRNVSFVVASSDSHSPFIHMCPACRQVMVRCCSEPSRARQHQFRRLKILT